MLIYKTNNKHYLIEENLQDKLKYSSVVDPRFGEISFPGAKDTNYLRAIAKIRPTFYYEISKVLKESNKKFKVFFFFKASMGVVAGKQYKQYIDGLNCLTGEKCIGCFKVDRS